MLEVHNSVQMAQGWFLYKELGHIKSLIACKTKYSGLSAYIEV